MKDWKEEAFENAFTESDWNHLLHIDTNEAVEKGFMKGIEAVLAKARDGFSPDLVKEAYAKAGGNFDGIEDSLQTAIMIVGSELYVAARLSILKELNERAELIQINRENVMDACSEATHYTWLDGQNEKLKNDLEAMADRAEINGRIALENQSKYDEAVKDLEWIAAHFDAFAGGSNLPRTWISSHLRDIRLKHSLKEDA